MKKPAMKRNIKKESSKKHSSIKRIKGGQKQMLYIRYISFSVIALIIVLAGKGITSVTERVHVLGTQTGPVLLADHGSDDSGGGSDSGGSSGGGSNSGSGNSDSGSVGGSSNNSGGNSGGGGSSNSGGGGGSGSDGSGNSNSTGSGNNNSNSQISVSDTAQVDCVGPDGNHFTTSFKSCEDFNDGWHNNNFHFTPLHTSSSTAPKVEESIPQQHVQISPEGSDHNSNSENNHDNIQQIQMHIPTPSVTEIEHKLEVKTDNEQEKINLSESGTQVEIQSTDKGIEVKAKKPDGTEVKLKQEDALQTVNDTLKEKDVKIGESENNTPTIKKGVVEAESELPIAVDPTTHELTVTTPAGKKTVTVLPDQAVNTLLENKLITSVESNVASESGAITQKTMLTMMNNEPVFEIKGIAQKRILGIIPIGFAKTSFVSATTGQVVKTDETLLNRIFEAISL